MTNEAIIKSATTAVYQARKDRLTHPEGKFDNAGRFYPSDVEDCDGSGSSVRSPSRAYPYSYMLRCRTKAHCKNLVIACLEGKEVPFDVQKQVKIAKDSE